MESKLKFLQLNLGKSKAAIYNLNQIYNDLQAQFILIQEPYVLNNKIIGFPILDSIYCSQTDPKCAIIIKDKTCSTFAIKLEKDLVALECTFSSLSIIVICVYISPNTPILNYLIRLDLLMATLVQKNIIFGGDFNAKNTSWGGDSNDDRGEQLANFFSKHNLIIINDPHSPPTFTTGNGRSWIDITVTSSNLHSLIYDWNVLDSESLSDHQIISYALIKQLGITNKRITQKGAAQLTLYIRNEPWFKYISSNHYSAFQIDYILKEFYCKFQQWIKLCERNVKNHKQQVPWWSQELQLMRAKTNALRRRFQRSRNSLMETYNKRIYYDYKNQYKDLILKSKIDSWHKYCFDTTKRSLFGVPYKLAFDKLKKPSIIPPIRRSDNTITTSFEDSIKYILDTLFPHLDPTIKNPYIDQIQAYTSTPPMTLPDSPFTFLEISTIINKLRNKTAPGLDVINVNNLRTIWTSHPHFLLSIFNSCLNIGYFPRIWKEGKIILINKNDRDNNLPGSYRPICLNSVLGKVLEKLINNRIYFFLNSKTLLHHLQFGFTHNKSSTLALYQLTTHLKQIKEHGKSAIMISLDFTNAFNSLRYPLVLNFLKKHECPSNLFNIIQSFFQDRIITFVTPNKQNISKLTNIGCPQGSPLSPLMWNILLTSLLEIRFHSHTYIQAFADDVVVVVAGSSRRELETRSSDTLNIIGTWASQNCLNFNYKKCQYLLITKGTYLQNRPPIVYFQTHRLPIVSQIKVLGIIYDSHLSFLPHLQYIKHKVHTHSQNISRIFSTNWGLSSQQLKDIYIRSIERYIVYGAPAWWTPTKNSHLLRTLISIQRIPLLKIAKAFCTVSNISLPVLCNCIPIEIILDIENFMFRLFQLHHISKFENVTIEPKDVSYPIDPWLTHPALKFQINFQKYNKELLSSLNNTLSLYTDGSVYLDQVGAAYVILKQNGGILKVGKYNLASHNTIFDAEAIAIFKGLEYSLTINEHYHLIVITDSLSVLQALANATNRNSLINNIKSLIQKIIEKRAISFYHVKSHSGVIGNELADQFANSARRYGVFHPLPRSKQNVKHNIIKLARKKWDQIWQERGQTSELIKWIPSITNIPSCFPPSYHLTQLLTAHGRFPFYFHRFNIQDHTICPCGESCLNIDHYLKECQLTQRYRKELDTQNLTTNKRLAMLNSITKVKSLTNLVQYITSLIP